MVTVLLNASGIPQYMHTSGRLLNRFKLYLGLKYMSQNWGRRAFNCDFTMKLKMEKVWNKMPIKLRYVEISSKPWSHGLYGGSLIDLNIYYQSVKERAGLGAIFHLNEPIMYQWCLCFDFSWSGRYLANECIPSPILLDSLQSDPLQVFDTSELCAPSSYVPQMVISPLKHRRAIIETWPLQSNLAVFHKDTYRIVNFNGIEYALRK